MVLGGVALAVNSAVCILTLKYTLFLYWINALIDLDAASSPFFPHQFENLSNSRSIQVQGRIIFVERATNASDLSSP